MKEPQFMGFFIIFKSVQKISTIFLKIPLTSANQGGIVCFVAGDTATEKENKKSLDKGYRPC